MTQQQTLKQIRAMKLLGLAQGLEKQWSQPSTYQDLSFDERLAMLIDDESQYRHNNRLKRLLAHARLKTKASVTELDYQHPRGLEKDKMANLLTLGWLERRQNLLITGPTGCGKTYLACAIGHQACLQGIRVSYYRASRLFEALTVAHGDGTYPKLIKSLAKAQLLIIDDWGLETLSPMQRTDLLEVMEDRYEVGSTLVTSQLPAMHWHERIGDATLADAILDRLIHNAHKLNLKGESLRLAKKPLTDVDQ